jgi:adenine deaminase
MELVNATITAERVVQRSAESGTIKADTEVDLLKVAMIDCHHHTAKRGVGFLKGFGAKVGAVGLTTNLDENALLIVGSNDADMARCANALLEVGGGIAIVNAGEILEILSFPLGGLFSLQPWRAVAGGLRSAQALLREKGSPFDKPLFALSFLPFVTLPALRITTRGLINAKERKIVSLFLDEVA